MKKSKEINYSNELGAAVVETAILLLIFLPLLFYAAFSGEAGMALLDMQEEPIAAIWDYSTFPYNLDDTPGASNYSKKSKIVMAAHRNWLTCPGNSEGCQDLISTFNRFQYADNDSSFTNEAKIGSSTMDVGISSGEEYYATNAFVQTTTCDEAGCQNYREKWDDHRVNEVICGVADRTLDGVNGKDVGGFMEGRFPNEYKGIPMADTGIAILMNKSPGALVVCQQKARLKNYLLPEKLFPEFSSTDLYSKGRYTNEKITDGKNDYKDIVVRHRIYLLTDTWALIERNSEHRDSKLAFAPDITNLSQTFSLDNLMPSRSRFQRVTNSVRNSIALIPAAAAAGIYSGYALQNGIAWPMVAPDLDNDNFSWVTDLIRAGTHALGLPNIIGLNMVAYYPKHSGSGHLERPDKYRYAPTIDVSGLGGIAMAILGMKPKYHTTPFIDGNITKYKQIYEARGSYYMGAKQSDAN